MDERLRLAERSGDVERIAAEQRRAGLDADSILRRAVREAGPQGLVEIWDIVGAEDEVKPKVTVLVVDGLNQDGIPRKARLVGLRKVQFLRAMTEDRSCAMASRLKVRISFYTMFKREWLDYFFYPLNPMPVDTASDDVESGDN